MINTYLICFEFRDYTDKCLSDFHQYLKDIASEFHHALSNAIVIRTDKTKKEMHKKLLEICQDNDVMYFILDAELTPDTIEGWMHSSFWNLIKTQKD